MEKSRYELSHLAISQVKKKNTKTTQNKTLMFLRVAEHPNVTADYSDVFKERSNSTCKKLLSTADFLKYGY